VRSLDHRVSPVSLWFNLLARHGSSPKVPATEKLFPFPQPLGVSYGYGSVGVGAR
jgi:hypothetical protein